METITHRELRNNSAAILRRVAAGETMEVSNHGVIVARLSPAAAPDVPFALSRPARRNGGWTALPRVSFPRPVGDLIDEERADH